MAGKQHSYRVQVRWTGNRGTGTSAYGAYDRSHQISVADSAKPAIDGSTDPSFRGDRARWNPEELLVASISACHKLWYLHLCSEAGICVLDYSDDAEGEMVVTRTGAGQFTQVTLRPSIVIAAGDDEALAMALHEKAHSMCFIANSVNFPIHCSPQIGQHS